MKKTYITPKTETVVIIGPRLMLTGSNNVNDLLHDASDDELIGDEE